MDIIDLLSKIKKLEREIEQLKLELKHSKQHIKTLNLVEQNLLKDFEVLSSKLAEHLPFTDGIIS